MDLTVGGGHVRMGTHALADGDWLRRDHLAPEEIALRRRLLTEQRDHVMACTPWAHQPAEEAADLVEQWLLTAPSISLPETGETHPLARAGALVQEDLCLMVHHDGAWHLEGAILCFPSFWALPEKLGRPTSIVHQPVPYFAEELASRVDRFFERLVPEKPVWRRNLSLWPTLLLWAPTPTLDPSQFDAGSPWWLRSERQTLRRLPFTGAILFTIRVQMAPLSGLTRRPDRARDLAAWLRAPIGETRRGQLGPRAPRVLEWLDEVARPA
ncbi:MAG TPA: DUF3445 domain-containing protein [Acidimicrobiales bacterium]